MRGRHELERVREKDGKDLKKKSFVFKLCICLDQILKIVMQTIFQTFIFGNCF